ncbi:MAG: ABC transporter permease [Rubrivivax sp.]|nr:ABC transporter permease [Rubrivivax sp.]
MAARTDHQPLLVRALPVYVTAAGLLLMAPIVIVIVLAFGDQGVVKFPPEAYGLRWFKAFFGDSRWQKALMSSLLVATLSCAMATALGFMAAYAMVRGRFGMKKLILSFVLMPMIVPHVITAIAMYFVSAPLNMVGNPVWIALCHSVLSLPIVLLILLSALQGVDANLERAALSLGSSRLRVFTRVVIPLAWPGIVSAALFAFLASFDELVISLFLAGVRAETLPVRIWNSLHLQVEPIIAAVSAFLIGVTALTLLLDAGIRRSRELLRGRERHAA